MACFPNAALLSFRPCQLPIRRTTWRISRAEKKERTTGSTGRAFVAVATIGSRCSPLRQEWLEERSAAIRGISTPHGLTFRAAPAPVTAVGGYRITKIRNFSENLNINKNIVIRRSVPVTREFLFPVAGWCA